MKLKPYLYAAAVLLVAVGAVAGLKALQIGKLIASAEDKGIPVETVSTTEVIREKWERSVESVGSLRAVQGADLPLRARMRGHSEARPGKDVGVAIDADDVLVFARSGA